jgi:hypothetical protein
VNAVRHFDQKRQILTGKTLRTLPLVLFVLVESLELDLARSIVAVLEHSGFDPANTNLMNGLILCGHRCIILSWVNGTKETQRTSDSQAQERGRLLIQQQAVTGVLITPSNPRQGIDNAKDRVRLPWRDKLNGLRRQARPDTLLAKGLGHLLGIVTEWSLHRELNASNEGIATLVALLR